MAATATAKALGIVLFIVTLVGIAFVVQNRSSIDSGEALDAEIRKSGPNITIRNTTAASWNQVRVRVGEDYWCPTSTALDAGQTMTIELPVCVAAGGRKFDVSTQAPLSVFLEVRATDSGDRLERSFTFAK